MSSGKPIVVQCPTCKRAVVWNAENTHKPFCSERCRLIDLGDWATETHKIPSTSHLSDGETDFLDPTTHPETW